MKKILSKIKAIHIVILLLILILFKLNTIAQELRKDDSVLLSIIVSRLTNIESAIQNINWNGIKFR